MTTKVTYRTLSGTPLDFNPYPQTGDWRDVAGIYCFAYNEAGTWRVLYVGQASSFRDRLPRHERWAEAVRKGATHVLAVTVGLQAQRDRIEAELISELQPPLNTLLR